MSNSEPEQPETTTVWVVGIDFEFDLMTPEGLRSICPALSDETIEKILGERKA